MSEPTTKSSVFRALSFVLKDNAGIAVFDYSCATDFRRLWSLENIAGKRILLIWSHTPLDTDLSPINAADCLSPIDWAVCFAAQKKTAPENWPEVMILDVQPALHGDIPSVGHLNALKPDQLPWLRVESDTQLTSVINWLATPRVRDRERCTAALRQFLRRIRLDLTDVNRNTTYDRHAISNIIGPMILRGKASNQTLHSSALLGLLGACDLIASSEKAADQPTVERRLFSDDQTNTAVQEPRLGEGLHVLLVDDQADHGWVDWVRECLLGASVSAIKDPTHLVREVKRQLDEAGTKDLRYRLKLPGLDEGKQPVLLLDLRLFSGNPDGERTFFKDTLQIGRAHV